MENDSQDPKLSRPAHATRVFPFPFASRTNADVGAPKLAQQEQANLGLFPQISNRMKNTQKTTTTSQSGRFPQQHHPRIFPLNGAFATPQRVRPKEEPMSPSDSDIPGHRRHGQPNANAYTSNFQIPQTRYLPTPQTARPESRAGSRVGSATPSLSDPSDADDQDFSELMNRRLKEAKMVKAQLADERVTSANLRSQLSLAQDTIADLEQRVSQLEEERETRQLAAEKTNEECFRARTQLEEVQASNAILLNSIKEKEEEVSEKKELLDISEGKIKAGEGRVEKIKDAAKRGIENLGKRYEVLEREFGQLKILHETSQENLRAARDEIFALKKSLGSDLKDAEAYFDMSGRHLLKCDETRGLVQELQEERNSGQRVIDLLRDKLHNITTQLAESQEKIRELEEFRKGEGSSLTKSVKAWEEVGHQVREMAGLLAKKESEAIDILSEGNKLEFQLKEANERVATLIEELEQKRLEQQSLVKENETLRIRSNKLDGVCKQLEECSSKYTATQDTIRAREDEIIVLKEKIIVLETATSKIPSLEEKIRKSKAEEAVSRTQADCALEKVKNLEAEIARLKRESDDAEEEARQLSSRLCVLQERFDAQTITMKLTKEHSGDLQDRLLLSEKNHATILEETKGKFKLELAILEEQKARLKQDIDNLRSTLDVCKREKTTLESSLGSSLSEITVLQEKKSSIQIAFDRRSEDCTKLESSNISLRTELAVVQEQARLLQSSLDRTKHDLVQLQSSYSKSQSEVSSLQAEKASLQDTLIHLRDDASKLESTVTKYLSENSALHADKSSLQKAVDNLKNQVTALQEQKATLRQSLDCLTEDSKTQQATLAGATEEYKREAAKQEQVYERALQAEVKKAEIAEQGLKQIIDHAEELKSRIRTLELQVEEAKCSALTSRSGDDSTDLRSKILEQDAEIKRLRERQDTLQERYKQGDLSESEKAFVDSLMGVSQAMYEQDLVEKDNELRRRDNMNRALQDKIHGLETTLAKHLKKKDNEAVTSAQPKSLVDLNLWMSSSPLTPLKKKSSPSSQIQGDVQNADPDHEAAEQPASKSTITPRVTFATTPVLQPDHDMKTFASLDEISDYDDDLPLTQLGKRSKPPSTVEAEPTKPARRQRTRKNERGTEKTTDSTKPKSKKRR